MKVAVTNATKKKKVKLYLPRWLEYKKTTMERFELTAKSR